MDVNDVNPGLIGDGSALDWETVGNEGANTAVKASPGVVEVASNETGTP